MPPIMPRTEKSSKQTTLLHRTPYLANKWRLGSAKTFAVPTQQSPFLCRRCGQHTFESMELLQQHPHSCPHTCPGCRDIFSSNLALNHHLHECQVAAAAHRAAAIRYTATPASATGQQVALWDRSVLANAPQQPPFLCRRCQKHTFESKQLLNRHLESCPLICRRCNQQLPSIPAAFAQHNRECQAVAVHQAGTLPLAPPPHRIPPKPTDCSHCGRFFWSRGAFHRHHCEAERDPYSSFDPNAHPELGVVVPYPVFYAEHQALERAAAERSVAEEVQEGWSYQPGTKAEMWLFRA
jgi:hypothetical protein